MKTELYIYQTKLPTYIDDNWFWDTLVNDGYIEKEGRSNFRGLRVPILTSRNRVTANSSLMEYMQTIPFPLFIKRLYCCFPKKFAEPNTGYFYTETPDYLDVEDFFKLLDEDNKLVVDIRWFRDFEIPVIKYSNLDKSSANNSTDYKDYIDFESFVRILYDGEFPDKFKQKEKENTMRKAYVCYDVTTSEFIGLCRLAGLYQGVQSWAKDIKDIKTLEKYMPKHKDFYLYTYGDGKPYVCSGVPYDCELNSVSVGEMIGIFMNDDPFDMKVKIGKDTVVFNNNGSIKVGCTTVSRAVIEEIYKQSTTKYEEDKEIPF